MIGAFILSMPERPEVDRLTDNYAKSMMTKPMKWFCQMSGKSKFTEKDIAGMKATAALKAADRNPYSWNMEFYEYPDGSGYEGRFTKCGICVLMQKLELYDLTPALCHLDYTLSEAGGVTDFVRQYTLASGGPYCDCGYKKGLRESWNEGRTMRTEEQGKLIRCCMLGAIGGILMTAGDWLLWCVPLQETDTGLFNRAYYLSGSYDL